MRTRSHRGMPEYRCGLVVAPHVQSLREAPQPTSVGHPKKDQGPRVFGFLGQDRAPCPAEVVTPPEAAPVVIVIGDFAVDAMFLTFDTQPPVGAQFRNEQPAHPAFTKGLIVDDERSADEATRSLEYPDRGDRPRPGIRRAVRSFGCADGERAEVCGYIQFGLVEPLDGSRPPLLVVNDDDARRHPQLTGAGWLAGEVEVDQQVGGPRRARSGATSKPSGRALPSTGVRRKSLPASIAVISTTSWCIDCGETVTE